MCGAVPHVRFGPIADLLRGTFGHAHEHRDRLNLVMITHDLNFADAVFEDTVPMGEFFVAQPKGTIRYHRQNPIERISHACSANAAVVRLESFPTFCASFANPFDRPAF